MVRGSLERGVMKGREEGGERMGGVRDNEGQMGVGELSAKERGSRGEVKWRGRI